MTLNLLPPNATLLERRLSATNAAIGDIPTPIRDVKDSAACPVPALPWLAWEESVDAWDENWTEAQKRAVIKAAYQVHKQKGTVGSVEDALSALGIASEITEWWQQTPRGVPHTFRVDVETYDGMDTNYLRSVNSQIDAVKPIRSHYTVRLIARPSMQVFVGAAVTHFATTTIYPKEA